MKIVIAGVVGAGKSTISTMLGDKINFEVLAEPVQENPFLDDFYQDQKAYAFKMQVYMLMARSMQLNKHINVKNVIYDRSLMEDPIFVEVLKQQNLMSDRDYQLYSEFYNEVICSPLYLNPMCRPDLIIYLRVNLQEAIKRIQKRGRDCEKAVSANYWRLLNNEYEKWYLKNCEKIPFLVIEASEKNPTEIITEITTFLKNQWNIKKIS